MTTYNWHTTYTNAVETFGGSTPGPELEQYLIDHFNEAPQTVIAAIGKAAIAYQAGRITSPWGIVRSELARIDAQPHIEATDTRSQHKQIAQAEAWIKHTGLHLTHQEVIDHLFAPPTQTATVEYLEQIELETRGNPGRPLYEPLLLASIKRTREIGTQDVPNTEGPLTQHDNPTLRQRLLGIWEDHQPLARRLEREAEDRANAWKQQQAAIKAARTAATTATTDDLPL